MAASVTVTVTVIEQSENLGCAHNIVWELFLAASLSTRSPAH
jgi:hypothetical protein